MNEADRQSLAEDWEDHADAYDRDPSAIGPEPIATGEVSDHDKADAYYEHLVKRYWWREQNRYITGGLPQLRRYLNSKGYSSAPPEEGGPSPADLELRRIESEAVVDAAIYLAGRKAGVFTTGNRRVLCPQGINLIPPVEGEFPTISAIFEGLLRFPAQVQVVYSWLKVALESLHNEKSKRGQAFIMAGPPGCGKTLLLEIITKLLGGVAAEPHSYMSGATDFNSELFSAVHQILDDEHAGKSHKDKRIFGARIKKAVATFEQRIHGKGLAAFRVPVFWRLSIALNDDFESLDVLPEFVEGIRDKIILLRVFKFELPVNTGEVDGEERLMSLIVSELPAFVHHLLNEFKIPEGLAGGRFGIKEYHNPELLDLLQAESPEDVFMEFIEEALFQKSPFQRVNFGTWGGSAAQLQDALRDCNSSRASELCWGPNVCGQMLCKLSKRGDGRVERGTEVRGIRQWIIRSADREKRERSNPANPCTQ